MRILRRLTSAEVAALATVVVVAVVLFAGGDNMFSSGPLNAKGRAGVTLGGATSHADLANNCAACHAPPWSGETMATRCLSCHTEVAKQLDGRGPLHGMMAKGGECRTCHTEHRGAHAAVTNLAHFDHDWAAFKLTGKHQYVDCASCHKSETYKGTPTTCAACHAEPTTPAPHKLRYGTACTQCHSTTTFGDATFKHTIFSINHGRRQNTCAKCHTDEANYKTYTCYGCHEHTPAKMEARHVRRGILDYAKCIDCHGRGAKGRGRRRADLGGLGADWCLAGGEERAGLGGCPATAGSGDLPKALRDFLRGG